MTDFALPTAAVEDDVRRALAEDIGAGDATADLLPAEAQAQAHILTREDAVLCGSAWAEACFRALDPAVQVSWHAHDGERVRANQRLVSLAGRARALVGAERCALNFLQTLSATATVTAEPTTAPPPDRIATRKIRDSSGLRATRGSASRARVSTPPSSMSAAAPARMTSSPRRARAVAVSTLQAPASPHAAMPRPRA